MREDYSALIQAIKAGDKAALHGVYLEYHLAFIEWAMARFRCAEADARDVYQDVIIAFYENIVEGKIDSLRSHIRTYLFGIGKIMLMNRFKYQQRVKLKEEQEVVPDKAIAAAGDYTLELSERQQLMQKALQQLGEKCRKLLTLFYYNRYSTEAIMQALDYRNPDVVKSQKSRCMRSLRALITQQFDRDVI